ncbi:hypothetical protein os4_22940 [Comamonadaceae bacterium OS-4]|nr:hypothetical protein os4_22940 [Comamonadaceae bacterium OS-4]
MPAIKNIVPLDVREYGRPPEPTAANPFAQVDWIFKKRSDRMENKATKENYKAACEFFKTHVVSTHGGAPYYLNKQWDEFALLRLKSEIEDRFDSGELQYKPLTMAGTFSCIRQAMKEAASYNLLPTRHLHDVNYEQGESETDKDITYPEAELDQIVKATKAELTFTKQVLHGYTPTNVGQDPRITPRRGAKAGYGYAVEANMRWYFEQVLQSQAIGSTPDNLSFHKSFLQAAADFHGGLNSMYRRWGVTSRIGMPLLMPLVIELMHATGLNPSSCLGLKTDCYREEHPLTGMPYLLYEKKRSDGELQLHLSLLDSRESQFLKREQSHLVKRVISQLLELTAPYRERIPKNSELKSLLLIYEGNGPSSYGSVLALSNAQTSIWCRGMVAQYALTTEAGKPLSFNLVRFRSTKLTEMALAGRDIFDIQQVAGHKSVSRTLAYISKRRLDAPARAVVAKALQTIKENRSEAPATPKSSSRVIPIHPIQTYKGLLSDCKNAFDPPPRVRQSKEFVQGQPCTRFNMCLFCHNVVVLRENLPTLFAYRSQILTAQDNNVQNLPHAWLYNDSLNVIDALMNLDESPFSPEDINWAIELAETLDVVIDPVLYRGVEE